VDPARSSTNSSVIPALRAVASELKRRIRQRRTPARLRNADKLHLGAGSNLLPGWANIDFCGPIAWDLRKPLPVSRGSVRLIYSEHFIEHLKREEGLRLLKDCRDLLSPGGVIRIATPDLKSLLETYLAGEFSGVPDAGWSPRSPCEMVNDAMRLWGHQFVYDEPELRCVMEEAGFSNVRRVQWGRSDIPELRNLESRPPASDDLILEATVAADADQVG